MLSPDQTSRLALYCTTRRALATASRMFLLPQGLIKEALARTRVASVLTVHEQSQRSRSALCCPVKSGLGSNRPRISHNRITSSRRDLVRQLRRPKALEQPQAKRRRRCPLIPPARVRIRPSARYARPRVQSDIPASPFRAVNVTPRWHACTGTGSDGYESLILVDRAERCRHDETVVFGIKEQSAAVGCGVKG